MTPKEVREEFDGRVYMAVCNHGPLGFGSLRAHVHPSDERHLDRSLQRLRKAGRVAYDHGKWYGKNPGSLPALPKLDEREQLLAELAILRRENAELRAELRSARDVSMAHLPFDDSPKAIAEAHRRASAWFRALSPDEQREQMRRAGVPVD